MKRYGLNTYQDIPESAYLPRDNGYGPPNCCVCGYPCEQDDPFYRTTVDNYDWSTEDHYYCEDCEQDVTFICKSCGCKQDIEYKCEGNLCEDCDYERNNK